VNGQQTHNIPHVGTLCKITIDNTSRYDAFVFVYFSSKIVGCISGWAGAAEQFSYVEAQIKPGWDAGWTFLDEIEVRQ
jgi:hypothetical protein